MGQVEGTGTTLGGAVGEGLRGGREESVELQDRTPVHPPNSHPILPPPIHTPHFFQRSLLPALSLHSPFRLFLWNKLGS